MELSRELGKGKDRRKWRKRHIGVEVDGFVVAAELTESNEDDALMVPALLEQVDERVRRFTADGAYDRRSVYERLDEVGTDDVKIVVPPRRPATRDENVREPGRSETLTSIG